MNEDILKQIATKEDLKELVTKVEFNKVLNRLDEIIGIMQRMDQERIFTFEYVKRLESEVGKNRCNVEKNSLDINRIKEILKIS